MLDDGAFVDGLDFVFFFLYAHGVAVEIETLGVVNEPVQCGGEGGSADDFVPGVHSKLADDQGCTTTPQGELSRIKF